MSLPLFKLPNRGGEMKPRGVPGGCPAPRRPPRPGLCPRTGSGHRNPARLPHPGHRGAVGRGAGRIARDRGLGWTLSRAGRAFKGKRPLSAARGSPARGSAPVPAGPRSPGTAPASAPAPLCRCPVCKPCVRYTFVIQTETNSFRK